MVVLFIGTGAYNVLLSNLTIVSIGAALIKYDYYSITGAIMDYKNTSITSILLLLFFFQIIDGVQ